MIFSLKRDGIRDLQTGNIQNLAAVIRREVTELWFTAERLQLTAHNTHCHRDHFNRQRESAEHRHELAFIGNADVSASERSKNLFPRQRSAAALHHVEAGIDLIGTVHIDLDLIHFIRIEHLETEAFQMFGRTDRARNTGRNLLAGKPPARREEINVEPVPTPRIRPS